MDGPEDRRPVLVTGGTGFIGVRCVGRLLDEGFRVRTTLRSVFRRSDVVEMLSAALVDYEDRDLEFVSADLTRDDGWAEAMAGCGGVLHVASPFPAKEPEDPDELVRPAREGTLRVLAAAREAGVDRVVLTSSFAAIGYGHPPEKTHFTEDDWSVDDGRLSAYQRSKTVAERAAWEYAEAHDLELAVINPVAVLGPVLGPDFSTSIALVQRMIDGKLPGLPKLAFGIVDVQDVAELHVRALTTPEAAGERFIAIGEDFWTLRQMAKCLRDGLEGDVVHRITTRPLPSWLVRVAARFNAGLRPFVSGLDVERHASGDKAQRILGWEPMPNDMTLISTAESLLELRKELADLDRAG